jgi:hypothetical protein
MQTMFTPENSSPPSVIAAIIVKAAIRSQNPKTRYAAGQSAKSTLFAKRWLSDKQFDKLIMRQFS